MRRQPAQVVPSANWISKVYVPEVVVVESNRSGRVPCSGTLPRYSLVRYSWACLGALIHSRRVILTTRAEVFRMGGL